MSIVVSGGKRGLTDPEIAKVILAAIPDKGIDKAHAWHVLLAPSYNLKRLPVLFVKTFLQPSCA
jgi:hypothetical protein